MLVSVFLTTLYSVWDPRSDARSSPSSPTLRPRYSVSSAAAEPSRRPLMASTSATLLAFGTASHRRCSPAPAPVETGLRVAPRQPSGLRLGRGYMPADPPDKFDPASHELTGRERAGPRRSAARRAAGSSQARVGEPAGLHAGQGGVGHPDRHGAVDGRGEQAPGGQAVQGGVHGQGVGPGQEGAFVAAAGDAAADRVEGGQGGLHQPDHRPAERLGQLPEGGLTGRGQRRRRLRADRQLVPAGGEGAAEADQGTSAREHGGAGKPGAGALTVPLGQPHEGAAERRGSQALAAEQAAHAEVEDEPADHEEGGGGTAGTGQGGVHRLILDLESAPLAGHQAGDVAAEVGGCRAERLDLVSPAHGEAWSAVRLRAWAGSTLIPGPIVVDTVMPLMYRPLAAAGLARTISSSTTW